MKTHSHRRLEELRQMQIELADEIAKLAEQIESATDEDNKWTRPDLDAGESFFTIDDAGRFDNRCDYEKTSLIDRNSRETENYYHEDDEEFAIWVHGKYLPAMTDLVRTQREVNAEWDGHEEPYNLYIDRDVDTPLPSGAESLVSTSPPFKSADAVRDVWERLRPESREFFKDGWLNRGYGDLFSNNDNK
jgi:hypothetical protein